MLHGPEHGRGFREMRIPYGEMRDVFLRILLKYGFHEEKAARAAELFTDNTCDGVASHGANRFPRVLTYIRKGHIAPAADPIMEESFGALERWNGNRGMGCTNASSAMDRAMELAAISGVGCVAMRNTNHWMRGGAYGLQAARKGFVGICWTNTMPNMPPRGGKERRIGNNPIIMALPWKESPVLIDGALAQFSYGAIEAHRLAGRQLPVPGGYDEEGRITSDPGAIEKTWRVLPIGFWKGFGLSIALDLIGALLSKGNTVRQIGELGDEIAVTQTFLAFNAEGMYGKEYVESVVEGVLSDLKRAAPAEPGGEILYPGEKEGRTRRENLELGIPVNEEIWESILRELA